MIDDEDDYGDDIEDDGDDGGERSAQVRPGQEGEGSESERR